MARPELDGSTEVLVMARALHELRQARRTLGLAVTTPRKRWALDEVIRAAQMLTLARA